MRHFTLVAASIFAASVTFTHKAEANQYPDLKVSAISTPGGICKQKKIRVSIVNGSQTAGTNDRIPVTITVSQPPGQPFSRIGYLNGIAPNAKSGQPVWFNDLPINTNASTISINARVNNDLEVLESVYNNNGKRYSAKCVPDTNNGGAQSNKGGKCDIKATMSGSPSSLPGNKHGKLNVKLKNIGKKACKAKKVALYRYKGKSTSGAAKKIGQLNLHALKPGKQKSLNYLDKKHPENGIFTYGIKFVGGHSDANNKNHKPKRTITYKKQANGGGNAQQGECDLYAKLVAAPGSKSNSREWKVKFKNIGKKKCNGNTISLSRYSGRSASGYGTTIGGSGSVQKLKPLGPNKTQTLKWTENRAPGGTYTYKVKYSGKQNDIDNSNHHPEVTVQ